MTNYSMKYKFKKIRVRFRKIWDFALLNGKKTQLTPDVDIAMKIIAKMMVRGANIKHSPHQNCFHLHQYHLYAKVSESSITIINGKYAYELALPPQLGYEIYSRIRATNERQLNKAEKEHRSRIEKSLQRVYDSLDEPVERFRYEK